MDDITTAPALHAATAYDAIPYPSAIFQQAHPERLAMLALLHGLTPPDITRARVLEIGGGDGLNAIAAAVALPEARFVNFDLAPTAIARGQAWSAAAGITNVDHLVLDICDAVETLSDRGPFDYIVAHGVYAWVPAPVRAAMMTTIGRLLAPNGVAMVSYNAMPGGYVRLAMRGLVNTHVDPASPPAARIARTRAMLAAFSEQAEDDEPVIMAMRREAKAMLDRPDAVLLHDELGDCFAPQALGDVIAAAADEGLGYLGDAAAGRWAEGFATTDAPPASEADFVAALGATDFAEGRYFRHSLFVRSGTAIDRRFSGDRLRGLWIAGPIVAGPDNEFRWGDHSVEVVNPALAAMLRRVAEAGPLPIPIATLAPDDEQAWALFQLADAGLVNLTVDAAPFTLTPGDTPRASPLIRAQIAAGQQKIATLNHRSLLLEDDRARAFVMLVDGQRDRAAIAEAWAATGHAESIHPEAALAMIATSAMLCRDDGERASHATRS